LPLPMIGNRNFSVVPTFMVGLPMINIGTTLRK
jgi:hypothetical protein